MHSLKTLKAVLLGLVALAAFAGTASATVLTSPAGTAYTGTKISHASGKVSMASNINFECKTSTLHEEVESHGAAATAVSKVSSLTFSECNFPLTAVKTGTLEVHGLGNGNGTVTGSGFEITGSNPVAHCVFTVIANNHIGTLTGSKNTGGTAILDVNAIVGRTGGSFLCGSFAEWKGTYVVQAPDYLDVD